MRIHITRQKELERIQREYAEYLSVLALPMTLKELRLLSFDGILPDYIEPKE